MLIGEKKMDIQINRAGHVQEKVDHLVPLRLITQSSFGSWFLAASLLFFCVSDTLVALNNDSSQVVKLAAFGLIGIAIALRPSFHRKIALFAPLAFSLVVSFSRAYDHSAGLEELLRFLCPVVITIGLFAYRVRLSAVLKMFFFIVITNDVYQMWAYLAATTGYPQLVPIRLDSGLIVRAQGWLGFFSEFSFINFCAFIICRRYQPTRRSRRVSWTFLVFALLGFSFKLAPALALYPLATRRLRWGAWLGIVAVAVAIAIGITSGLLDTITGVVLQKIAFYIVDGNSARAESYRVMIESLSGGNLMGEGLGTFGGPASIKYGSPLYSIYHFNWYGLANTLKTTDTFYPHLFVELGLIGGVVWLWMVLKYGNDNRVNRTWLLIAAAFCFDNAFSLAFVSPSYVFAALLTMYLFRETDQVQMIRVSSPDKKVSTANRRFHAEMTGRPQRRRF